MEKRETSLQWIDISATNAHPPGEEKRSSWNSGPGALNSLSLRLFSTLQSVDVSLDVGKKGGASVALRREGRRNGLVFA